MSDPNTIWRWTEFPPARPGQKHVAHGGVTVTGTFARFCRTVLKQSTEPYAKGRGPHWLAATLLDGHRCKESAQGLTLLPLDYDGGQNGWEALQAHLDAEGLSYCLYETSSANETTRKWRAVLPLDAAVDVREATGGYAQWAAAYTRLRQHFEGIAGVTFDPALKSAVQAIYYGNPRSEEDTYQRRVVSRTDGSPLGLGALLETLPEPETKPAPRPSRPARDKWGDGVWRPADPASPPDPQREADALAWLSRHPAPGRGAGLHQWLLRAAGYMLAYLRLSADAAVRLIGSPDPDRPEEVVEVVSWVAAQAPQEARPVPAGAEEFTLAARPAQGATPAVLPAGFDPNIRDRALDILRGLFKSWGAEAEEEETYWGPLRARVAARRRKAQGIAPSVLQGAKDARKLGREWGRELRASWRAQGLPASNGCGHSQGLGNVRNGRMAVRHLGCGSRTCPICGPVAVATRAAAVATMPIQEDGLSYPALQDRTIYRFTVAPGAGWEAWARQFRRSAQVAEKKDLSGFPPDYIGEESVGGNPDKPVNPASYAAFQVEGKGWVVFCTLSIPPKGVEADTLEGREAVQGAVKAALEGSSRVVADEVVGHRVTGKIRSANNLLTDTEGVWSLASGSEWVEEEKRVSKVPQAGETLASFGLLPAEDGEDQEDGTPSYVATRETVPVRLRKAVWSTLRVSDTTPTPAPVSSHPSTEEEELDALVDAMLGDTSERPAPVLDWRGVPVPGPGATMKEILDYLDS